MSFSLSPRSFVAHCTTPHQGSLVFQLSPRSHVSGPSTRPPCIAPSSVLLTHSPRSSRDLSAQAVAPAARPLDISSLLADLQSVKSQEEELQKRKQEIESRIRQYESGETGEAATPSPTVTPPLGLRRKSRKRSKSLAAVAAAAGFLTVPSTSAPPESPAETPSPPPSSLDVEANKATSSSTLHPLGSVSELGDNMWIAPWTPSAPLENDPQDSSIEPKHIYIISDCTGESAARTVRAALGQFQEYLKRTCPANLLVVRFLSDEKKAYEIIERAKQEDALVVFSLVDPKMVKAVKTAAQLFEVKAVDLWSTLLDRLEDHLHTPRSGVPLGDPKRRAVLSDDYFKMIEAVEYTRKMDDGACPSEWKNADLLILGVSRSGKTPLSIYLGQRGYKVANLPLVPGCPVPKELYEIDQSRVVGLVIDPVLLSSIRRNRMGSMGLQGDSGNIDYAEMKKIQSELEWARALYRENPEWPVLDVTFRGVEETAARILRVMSERRGHLLPMWAEEHNRSHTSS